jgi:hypothetical protein
LGLQGTHLLILRCSCGLAHLLALIRCT